MTEPLDDLPLDDLPLPTIPGIDLQGKVVDVGLLQQEMLSAGLPPMGVGTSGNLLTFVNDQNQFVTPTPEIEAVVAAHNGQQRQQTATFALQEDEARLQLVQERASQDPAFAALADLTLGKQGVVT